MVREMLLITTFRLEKLELQALRALLRFLHLLVKSLALFEIAGEAI